jgi:hypothetical protein
MSFWSAVGPEPKRNYRWVVRFAGAAGLSDISFALKKVDKPKLKIASVAHSYLNHKFKYPGRVEWEPIAMTFAAVAQPDAINIVNNVILGAGYGVPTLEKPAQGAQLATVGKRKFNNAMGNNITIIQVDADGLSIEEWDIYHPFFTSITFGALDYSSEEIVEINCNIDYDWAQLRVGSSDEAALLNPGFPGTPNT